MNSLNINVNELDNLLVPLVLFDSHFKIVYSNKAFRILFNIEISNKNKSYEKNRTISNLKKNLHFQIMLKAVPLK